MSEQVRFKVGDRVQLTKAGASFWLRKAHTATVTEVFPEFPNEMQVLFDDQTQSCRVLRSSFEPAPYSRLWSLNNAETHLFVRE